MMFIVGLKRRKIPLEYRVPVATVALLLFLGSSDSISTAFSASQTTPSKRILPRHVAFICDGNSRWAEIRHLPTAAGHAAGAERLVEVLDDLRSRAGISYCTMYAFSTENWLRPKVEVEEILRLMESTAKRFRERILRDRVRVQLIGDLTDPRLPLSLVQVLTNLQDESKEASLCENDPLTFSIAINYGGRQDIVHASKLLASQISQGAVDLESVTEESFSSLLSTNGIPDPDLIVRTSGECRLSNFLLWNAAYAEIYFTDTFWPDFDTKELEKALDWFATRQRRYGTRTLEKLSKY